jgi:citrate synthase
VSSDGPEHPARVQLNKGLIGFLSHCGYAHGGNGYEGVAFLLEQFAPTGLKDPSDKQHGIDLEALAKTCVDHYVRYKTQRKNSGHQDVQKIPGINHPVFKDKPVNWDPREVYIREAMAQRGEYNIFLSFYHALVQALFRQDVSRNVYCVNVDALISALLLKMVWPARAQGGVSDGALETAAFSLFLLARMIGCAAEVDDHLNRGRNMDTRTPASLCRFVS